MFRATEFLNFRQFNRCREIFKKILAKSALVELYHFLMEV